MGCGPCSQLGAFHTDGVCHLCCHTEPVAFSLGLSCGHKWFLSLGGSGRCWNASLGLPFGLSSVPHGSISLSQGLWPHFVPVLGLVAAALKSKLFQAQGESVCFLFLSLPLLFPAIFNFLKLICFPGESLFTY